MHRREQDAGNEECKSWQVPLIVLLPVVTTLQQNTESDHAPGGSALALVDGVTELLPENEGVTVLLGDDDGVIEPLAVAEADKEPVAVADGDTELLREADRDADEVLDGERLVDALLDAEALGETDGETDGVALGAIGTHAAMLPVLFPSAETPDAASVPPLNSTDAATRLPTPAVSTSRGVLPSTKNTSCFPPSSSSATAALPEGVTATSETAAPPPSAVKAAIVPLDA